MPDLKSELKKLEALRFDDDGETQPEITTHDIALPARVDEKFTNGVSAALFNVVRDNAGSNRSRLIAMADAAGIARASSSSLITQFTQRGLIRATSTPNGIAYFPVAEEYVKGYVRREKKADTVAPPRALAVAPNQDTSVQDLLNTMSIVKARALYDELRKIFGG
jgi:hypothetical protein